MSLKYYDVNTGAWRWKDDNSVVDQSQDSNGHWSQSDDALSNHLGVTESTTIDDIMRTLSNDLDGINSKSKSSSNSKTSSSMSDTTYNQMLESLGADSSITKGLDTKDIKNALLNQLLSRDASETNYQNQTNRRYNDLLSKGASRAAALQSLLGTAPTATATGAQAGTAFSQMEQTESIAAAQRAIDWTNATANIANSNAAMIKAYWDTYDTRFKQEGRDLVNPIASVVFGWITEHEDDPKWVIPDEAKRSPERFKRWCLAKDAEGNYLRPDAASLIHSKEWLRMRCSAAGRQGFRMEFAATIEGKTPHEMEWEAAMSRENIRAQVTGLKLDNMIKSLPALRSDLASTILQINTGTLLENGELNTCDSWEANVDDPLYDTFFNSDGSIKESLPIYLETLCLQLDTEYKEAFAENGLVEQKYNALGSSYTAMEAANVLQALMYGKYKDVWNKLTSTNAKLGDELFEIQAFLQSQYGIVIGRDGIENPNTLAVQRSSVNEQRRHNTEMESITAQTAEVNADIDAYNADTKRQEAQTGYAGKVLGTSFIHNVMKAFEGDGTEYIHSEQQMHGARDKRPHVRDPHHGRRGQ